MAAPTLRTFGAPLLATTVQAPPLRPNTIRRPRLTAQLDANLAGKLTLRSAPPGFGKTSILGEWYSYARTSGSGSVPGGIADSSLPASCRRENCSIRRDRAVTGAGDCGARASSTEREGASIADPGREPGIATELHPQLGGGGTAAAHPANLPSSSAPGTIESVTSQLAESLTEREMGSDLSVHRPLCARDGLGALHRCQHRAQPHQAHLRQTGRA